MPSSKDKSIVVLPNHLQALVVECSHLSFGTYSGSSNVVVDKVALRSMEVAWARWRGASSWEEKRKVSLAADSTNS